MTRDRAYPLVDALVDAGHSCTLAITPRAYGIARNAEHCSIHITSQHLDAAQLQTIITIAQEHNTNLHLESGELRYIQDDAVLGGRQEAER